MSFDPAEFISEFDLDEFDQLNKDMLIVLGEHLGLNVKKAMRKAEIQLAVVKCLVNRGLLDESALFNYVTSDPEVRKLELHTQLEIRKLEFEREKLAQKEREREQEKQFELEKQRMKHELELKKLEIESSGLRSKSSPSPENFDVTKQIRLVPPFQEAEVDNYFLHFEKIARNLKWPKEFWTMLLQSVLIGKAREIYTQLSVEQASDYDCVKELILKGYELVPEAYHQKFRGCRREASQTFVEFARIKEQLFDRWCTSRKIKKNFEELRQLILIEEFKRCIGINVRTFINEQKAECLEAAARLADDYTLPTSQANHQSSTTQAHDQKSSGNVSQSQCMTNNLPKNISDPVNSDVHGLNPRSASFVPNKSLSRPFSSPICNYCKKQGHVLSECFKLKRKQIQDDSSRPTGCLTVTTPKSNNDLDLPIARARPTSDSIMEVFMPFLYDGYVSLPSEGSKAIPIRILRDTGASQSLIAANVLPFSDSTYSGTSVLIQGVDSPTYSSVPLHHVHLMSDLVTGPVSVGIKSSLPFDGVHLLLGNDLAGDKVKVNPLLTEKPCYDQKLDSVEQEIPGLYPSCVVTRSMSKIPCNEVKQLSQDSTIVPSSGSTSDITSHSSDDTKVCSENTSFCTNATTDHANLEDILFKQAEKQPSVSNSQQSESDLQHNNSNNTSQLVIEQHNDPEIDLLFQEAIDEEEAKHNRVCYYIRNGVLMCKWRPLTTPADQEWSIVHQIVVPKVYRSEILTVAHEHPLSGHLGVNKTYNKILQHFFWPNLRKDVSEHCRSCHTCQMVGKPNQTISKARLHPIPAMGEPFSKVLVDCVGPLIKTKSGNQYLLTIMCMATRFPEAIPLRKINAKSIVKALIKFFTFVGLFVNTI